jgi:hypothetical protein
VRVLSENSDSIDLALPFPLLARRVHKWLAVLVGIQAVVWTLGGVYMTAINIDIIHGDHFVRSPATNTIAASRLADPLAVMRAVAGGEALKLAWVMDRPIYIVAAVTGTFSFDARTGRPLPTPPRSDILKIADYWHIGDEALESAELIDKLPSEVRGRKPPLWRVSYGGWNKPTFYLSPQTGELLTRRHELWRVLTSSGCSTSWTMTSAKTSTTRFSGSSPGRRQCLRFRVPVYW